MDRRTSRGLLLCLCGALLLPLWAQAQDTPQPDSSQCRRIATGPGPEDMAHLPGASTHLLISSHDRRRFESTGAIYLYAEENNTMRPLPRLGEPAGLELRPHGIDISTREGKTLLYVVNHDREPNSNNHSILVYEVHPDALQFVQQLRDPLLSSPNDISVAPDGDLYVSNDRKDGSSTLELVLRRAKANVVQYHGGHWRIVADHLLFPNGVLAEKDRVLVSLTFGSAFLLYPRNSDGSLGSAQKIAEIANLDNIMPGPSPDTYLVSSHLSLMRFMRHKGDSRYHSPSTVYEVNVKTHQTKPYFVSDGSPISAITTALLTRDALYLSQGFDAFILRCPLKQPAASTSP